MQVSQKISTTGVSREIIKTAAQLAFELSGGTLKARPLELASAGGDSVLGYFHGGLPPRRPLDQDGIRRMVIDSKLVSLHNFFSDVEQVGRVLCPGSQVVGPVSRRAPRRRASRRGRE